MEEENLSLGGSHGGPQEVPTRGWGWGPENGKTAEPGQTSSSKVFTGET